MHSLKLHIIEILYNRYENPLDKQTVSIFDPELEAGLAKLALKCNNVKETVHGHVLVRVEHYFKMAAKVSLIR